MKRIAGSLIIMLLIGIWCPMPVMAVVSLIAEWNWADYQRDVDGAGSSDRSHFYQQYSLLYKHAEGIQGGLSGGWSVGLGYEWTALNISGDASDRLTTGKLLYEGVIDFRPRVLPLALYAYSRDMSSTLPAIIGGSGDIITPGIYGGLHDGTSWASGLTLQVGAARNREFGDYRGALMAFPRLLFDYREVNERDDKALDPVHTRTRDLAFISLNRSSNWFHYKTFEHQDFNDPLNDYKQWMYLLGTVDHLNRRQWIHMTNWLLISADGSLTEIEGRTEGKEKIYRLNLFSDAKRNNWYFSNFTSLARSYDDDRLSKSFEFPLIAGGQWDPLLKWRVKFFGSRWEELLIAGGASELRRAEDTIYTSAQLESRRYEGKVLVPRAEMEWLKDLETGSGEAARMGFELRSDWRRDRSWRWLVDFSTARFASDLAESAYYEQVGKAAIDYLPNTTVSMGVTQTLSLGTGDYAADVVNRITPTIALAPTGGSVWGTTDERSLTGTSYRSTTEAYLELTPPGRWRNRFDVYFDYSRLEESTHQARIDHVLNYAREGVNTRARTSLAEGDDLSYVWGSDDIGGLEATTGVPELLFNHETLVDYAPNRHWLARGKVRATWGRGERGSGSALSVTQNATYHLFTAAGIPRKWLTLEEDFEYNHLWGDLSIWTAETRLSASYFATRYLTLNARAGFKHYSLTGQNQFDFELGATAAFRMLVANISYAYGQRDAADFLPGVKEQRWEVGLKKVF